MLTYADEIWYAYEGIPMPSWWADTWTHLDDQRLGGIIMWIPGGFFTFLSMTICFFVWVAREKEKDLLRLERQEKLDLALSGKKLLTNKIFIFVFVSIDNVIINTYKNPHLDAGE